MTKRYITKWENNYTCANWRELKRSRVSVLRQIVSVFGQRNDHQWWLVMSKKGRKEGPTILVKKKWNRRSFSLLEWGMLSERKEAGARRRPRKRRRRLILIKWMFCRQSLCRKIKKLLSSIGSTSPEDRIIIRKWESTDRKKLSNKIKCWHYKRKDTMNLT